MKNSDTLGRPSINRHLPDGHRLVYVVSYETHYFSPAERQGRAVWVAATSPAGTAWELEAEERRFDGTHSGVAVKVFDDSFTAFTQGVDLFRALAEHGEMDRIEEFIAVLNELGIEDVTQRTAPSNPKENR